MVYSSKTIIFQRANIFHVGSNFFQVCVCGWGVQLLIPIESYRTCDHLWGSGSPVPLWIRAWWGGWVAG